MMLVVLYFELSLAKLVLNLTQMGLINIPRCVALSFCERKVGLLRTYHCRNLMLKFVYFCFYITILQLEAIQTINQSNSYNFILAGMQYERMVRYRQKN